MGKIEAAREATIAAWHAIIEYSDGHNGARLASEQRELAKLGEEAIATENRYRAMLGDDGDVTEAHDDIVTSARTMLARTTGRTGRTGLGVSADGQTIPFPGGHPGTSHRPSRASIHTESWGQTVVDGMSQGGRFQAAVLSGGAVPVTVPLLPTPVSIAQRPRFLRELIPGMAAPNGRVSYLRQTVRSNNAAVVASGALKPTSVYTMVRVDTATVTIAHLSEPVPRQDIADANLLRDYIDGELRYGLDLALDDQILNGNGTPPNMFGILQTSGIQTQAFATDAIQSCRKGITKLEASDLEPRAFVMNPAAWEKVELLAQAQFASNDGTLMPIDAMARRLFGVPVLVSNAMAANVALLGDFASSSVLFTTQDASVDWSENSYDPNALGAGVGASDFGRNMIRFRAEGRWYIAVTRPLGFVSIALA